MTTTNTTTTANTEVKPQPRSRFRRIIRLALTIIVSIICLLLIGLGITYYRWTRSPLPQLDGELKLAGLIAPVTIARDQWGVPHITATTLEDAVFAQGYTLAQDRLWQMDLARRAACGELSEVLGAGDKDAQLELDKLHRKIGLKRAAERSLAKLPEDHKRLLAAYSRGVNAYINAHRDSLPLEFRLLGYQPAEWQPLDTLSIGKLFAISLTNNWKFDLMRGELAQKLDPAVYKMLFYEQTPYDQPIYPLNGDQQPESELPKSARHDASNNHPQIDPDLFASVAAMPDSELFLDTHRAMLGSNNWVISGKKSATGKPILANDPHQGLTLPAVWYQIHIRVTDGSYHAAGVAIMGAPGIVIGHNEHIAWGATNLMGDVQDLYVEEFDTANPNKYRVGTEWRDAEVIKEKIKVRQSMKSSATTEVDHEIVITRHGPIVSQTAQGQKLALRWTGLDAESELISTFNLNRARNWQEFCNALKDYSVPTISYVYGDVEGNIGYYAAGKIPIRATGDGSKPYDGKGEDGEWKGYVPFEEMPHLYNPPDGYALSANQRVTGASYPYTLANDWAPPYRAHRVNQLLAAQERFTLEDMHKMHADNYGAPYHLFSQVLTKMAARHTDDARWKELADEVKDWDGMLQADSRKAAVVSAVRSEFMKLFFTAWLGDLSKRYDWYRRSGVIDYALAMQPAEWLPKQYQSYDELMMKAYDGAIQSLNEACGPNRSQWRYGAINKVTFGHPLAKIDALKPLLNPPSLEAPGSAHSINAIDSAPSRMWGPTMRMVISLADFNATTQSIVPGQSAQMASPFYANQINDWLVVKPHAFPFDEKTVQPLIVNKLILSPGK